MPHYAKPKPGGWTCPMCGRLMQREWTPHTCNGQFRKHWPKPRKPTQHAGYADAGCIAGAVALVLFFWWLLGRFVESVR